MEGRSYRAGRALTRADPGVPADRRRRGAKVASESLLARHAIRGGRRLNTNANATTGTESALVGRRL
jgi:hypothetical protein